MKKILVDSWCPAGDIYILNESKPDDKEWDFHASVEGENGGEVPQGPPGKYIILLGCKRTIDDLPDPNAKRKKTDKKPDNAVYGWCVLKEPNRYFYKNGKVVQVPFDYYYNNDKLKDFTSFIIKRNPYENKMDLILKYINYFITFYDKDQETIMAYLKLKSMIDDREREINPEFFRKIVYSLLFSNRIIDKIDAFVEDNYLLNIDEETSDKKFADQTRFTDKHTKILFKVSMGIKMMIPVICHYINNTGLDMNAYLFRFYKQLLTVFSDEQVNLTNKLWKWINIKVKTDLSRNALMWDKRAVYGEDPVASAIDLFHKHILVDTVYKYEFYDWKKPAPGNPILLNGVVVESQLKYSNKQKYAHNLVDISPQPGETAGELSKLDKLLMNATKVDESLVVISEKNIDRTIQKIKEEVSFVDDDEIEFYYRYHTLNPRVQMVLVNYFYAKYFNGYMDLNMISKRQYVTLMVLLKKRLRALNYTYLPYIISSNIQGKVNNRIIRNVKFMEKLSNTPLYNIINEEELSLLNKDCKDESKNPIMVLMSLLVNSKFTYVDFKQPELMGEIIEINEDMLCDEFIKFVNLI